MSTSLAAARHHHRNGRLRIAAAASMELLASDAATSAAALLLQIRIDQGWFGDAVRLAAERFRTTLPATTDDCAAVLRMQVARIFAGADPDDSVRAMHAVAATARAGGDPGLQALATESIAKASVAALQLTGSPEASSAFDDLYRHAASLYARAHDRDAQLAVLLQLGNVLIPRDPEAARRLFEEVEASAPMPVRLHALLRKANVTEVDLDTLAAAYDAADVPLGRARVLRQKVHQAWSKGVLDESTSAAALEIFRSEGALLDVAGFSAALAENAFRLGHFASAARAARDCLEAAQVMPFPYNEANARLMLASSLHQQGKFLESAAQYERIFALPSRYRRKRHLDILPSIGFLLQVRQAERARQLALEYVAELEGQAPSPELSIALHYLANASVDLRLWPDVFTALERSAAVDNALGNVPGTAMKRIELASWRIKAHWLGGQAPPALVFDAAMQVFEEEEQRLAAIQNADADHVRMNLHQARAMAFQAIAAATAALDALERFGEMAQHLGSEVHQANYHTQAGLILHDLGREGDAKAALKAQEHLDEALVRAMRTDASDTVANAAYLAAANERVLARFARTEDDQSEHLSRALALLQEADRRIAQLQMQYVEPGSEAAQMARIAIHGPWKKVYDIAVELLLLDAGEAEETYAWIEKWKGRALAVTLGLRRLVPPPGIPTELLAAEADAIAALECADDYETLTATRDRLQDVWDRLAAIPEAAEYMSLRTGRPVTFDEMVALLGSEEQRLAQTQSPKSTNGAQNDGSAGWPSYT